MEGLFRQNKRKEGWWKEGGEGISQDAGPHFCSTRVWGSPAPHW